MSRRFYGRWDRPHQDAYKSPEQIDPALYQKLYVKRKKVNVREVVWTVLAFLAVMALVAISIVCPATVYGQ